MRSSLTDMARILFHAGERLAQGQLGENAELYAFNSVLIRHTHLIVSHRRESQAASNAGSQVAGFSGFTIGGPCRHETECSNAALL